MNSELIYVESVCPECKHKNILNFEKASDTIKSIKSINGIDVLIGDVEYARESETVTCENENCGCDYYLSDSDNWNEIQAKLNQ